MKRQYIIILLAALGLTSCSVDKFLQPGQKVLQRNEVVVTMADSSVVPPEVSEAVSNLQQYYYQEPNRRFLFMRVGMRLYCSTNPSDTSSWSRFWRNQGEPPVIYDPIAASRTANQMATLLKTKGCFNSTVTTDTVHDGSSFVIARYNIKATQRRKIDEVRFGCRQPEIDSLMKKWKNESFLKEDDYYDQQKMTQEQSRIASLLRDSGYYYASPDLVQFYVDTTYDSQRLSISVRVRLPMVQNPDSAATTYIPLKRYHIDNVYLYPNITTAVNGPKRQYDTLIFPYPSRNGHITNYQFIYDNKISPSPRTICRSLFIRNGQAYRPIFASITSNTLFGLHNFKFIDINYEESPNSTDTNALLDARIRLLNNTQHRLALSFEISNASGVSHSGGDFITSGNLGLGTSLSYRNCNLFGGAEALNVETSLLFDLPKKVLSSNGNDFYNTFSAFENSLNLTLDLPSFLIPFSDRFRGQYSRPHTLVGLSANYIFRNIVIPLKDNTSTELSLERILFSGSYGYTWNHRRNHQHKLIPFNLTYTHIISGAEYYYYLHEITSDWIRFFFQSYDYVLLNTHYEYTYTNQTIGKRNNFDYLNFSVETAGNLINAVDRLINKGNSLDSLYYQYIRFEGEYKRYIYWGKDNTLVLRLLAGAGIPYGHSFTLPYEKMFIGGGPNTMRGWPLRRLGGYGLEAQAYSDIALGVGEIMLVSNIEQRFPIVSIFEGAVFADIGNVWDYSSWGIGKDKKLNPSYLLNTIALDAGIGLRANISIITLRLDLALPIYDPGYSVGERWIGTHWSWDKIALNFGINYPF